MQSITVKELKQILNSLPPELENNLVLFKHDPDILALEYITRDNLLLLDITEISMSSIKEKIQ